mgnify:CR=1 FL=1
MYKTKNQKVWEISMIKSYVIDTNIFNPGTLCMSVFWRKQGDIAIGCIRRTGRPEESRRRKAGRLVTKDLVLRLKAQIFGIEAQDFSTEQVIEEEGQYSGRQICYVAEDKFKEFKKKGVHLKELICPMKMVIRSSRNLRRMNLSYWRQISLWKRHILEELKGRK